MKLSSDEQLFDLKGAEERAKRMSELLDKLQVDEEWLRKHRAVASLTQEQLGTYLLERMQACGFKSISEFGKALGFRSRTQIYSLISGRDPIGPKVLERLNSIDPELEIFPAYALYAKKKTTKPGLVPPRTAPISNDSQSDKGKPRRKKEQ